MFPQAYADGAGPAVQSLFITSDVATSGTITIPSLNFNSAFSVQANGVVNIVLPSIQVTDSDVVTAKGIRVTSQLPVSVYGLNKRHSSSDAFLGLPVNALGMDHYVLTYSNMSFAPSTELGVVAAENNTTVTIIPPVTTLNRLAGVAYNITLHQGQTYLLKNSTPTREADLSGSRISSDKPVAVFAGHNAATIPAEAVCCADHLVEQVPPVSSWGKRFATVPIATRTKGDFFRFIAAEDETGIYLNGHLALKLNAGEYAELILTARTEIISTKPIMVAQYATSVLFDPSSDADPFMMIIPPYSQFLNHYTISTPVSGFATNYANIIAPTASLGSITLDGAPIPATGFTPIGVSGFSGAQVPLSIGSHTLEGSVNFGVFVYGFNRDEGYGYPGGMNMTAMPRAINVSLAPETSTSSINKEACVTATVTDESQNPLGGQVLTFTVTGANPSTASLESDAAGQARLCYLGTHAGTDNVTATLNGSSGDASIVWTLPNQAPVAQAGSDQIVTLPAPVALSGTATDDGLPLDSLIFTWSQLTGPGTASFANASAATTDAVFDLPGVYTLRLTVDDGELSSTDDLQVTVNPAPPNGPPAVNAGPDLSVAINSNLVVNGGNDFALIDDEISGWIQAAGTSWARPINSNVAAQRGEAYFVAGDESQAELRQDIDVSSFAHSIDAGSQQFEFKAYVRSAVEAVPDAARVVVEYRDAANASILATLDSGPITSTADWHLTEDSRIAPAGTKWIRVRLIATRNTGDSNDAFFDSISLRPIGNIAARLNGVAEDDGLPFGGTLTSTWNTNAGPDVVAFANANSPVTSASFTSPGVYVLSLTSSDGTATVSDEVTISINPANQPPLVAAGADQNITLPGTAIVTGSVTDDGQPSGNFMSIRWSVVSGPGIVTFTDANQAATSAGFSGPGVYLLRLSADDGEYASTSDVLITVNSSPDNQPPTVRAGADQTISLPTNNVTLAGVAADDGLPVGSTLAVEWTMISGPGNVVFGSPNTSETSAQFNATGTYVLRFSATDGEYFATDDLTVTVTPQNQPPVAMAGVDQTTRLSQPVQLDGAASDDGLPPGTLTTIWSKASGPGMVAFDNANVTITGARFTAVGSYVLQLTASDGAASDTDEVVITVIDDVAPPVVEITSPVDGAGVTEPALVTGSVSGGNWILEYSLNAADGDANQIWTQVSVRHGPSR